MELELTPEQDGYVRRAVESGRVENPENALREALDFWIKKEEFENKIQHIVRFLQEFKDDNQNIAKIVSVFALAFRAFELETNDDPFHAFDEWDGDADRKAYVDL